MTLNPRQESCLETSRLLVRGVNWLGDAVMTAPAIERLRQRFPRAHISILADDNVAGIWPGHPGIDDVIAFRRTEGLWSIAARIKAGKFDTAVILPNSPRSALESWLANIPCRVGYSTPWRRCLLTVLVQRAPGHVRPRKRGVAEIRRLLRREEGPKAAVDGFTHQVHDYLRLAAALGADAAPLPPRLTIGASEVESALARLQEWVPGGKPANRAWLGLNVSAAYGPAKCWPLERFAEVVKEVSRRVPDCVWLNFGTRSDSVTGDSLAAMTESRVINLAGKTTLRELMALLKCCRLLLGNDSGPMHLAAALGTPVVALFGSTSLELTGPGLGDTTHQLLRGSAPCSPCFRRECPVDFRCMTSISVEQTTLAILKVLKQAEPSPT